MFKVLYGVLNKDKTDVRFYSSSLLFLKSAFKCLGNEMFMENVLRKQSLEIIFLVHYKSQHTEFWTREKYK